ncbi:MAG: tetratricopeptide repeat protein [Myxococcales bacterium]|nr:tetratricopeptide repeat protein [Myxococcales bacterium]
MDRLEMLRQFASQRPDDPFPKYGVAMELRKRGELAAANAAFAELMTRHPEYVAAYLMAGNCLVESGDPQAAAAVFDRGIAAATRAGDAHARGELEAARGELS